jgi:signal transduction histidine kinase
METRVDERSLGDLIHHELRQDAADARGIWMAVQQPGLKAVAVKSEEQQAVLAPGGRVRLLGISKRGDRYLRTLREAAGHVEDLESALEKIRELERQRGETWQQAAHDLRGNLAVVANVTVGLTRHGKRDSSRDDFVRILMRNVTSLHHLLEDVTSLARLQAGRESRQIEPLDVTAILLFLCEGIRPLAAQRALYLNCDRPDGFAADGDGIKIRRIGQNLLLNAVKYTHSGGITVTWGDSTPNDPKRWALCITDTGPGLRTDSGQSIAAILEPSSEPLSSSELTVPA